MPSFETRVAIYQPRYFPQLHYFHRALHSDVFVILASAQYTKSLVHVTEGKIQQRHPSYQSDTPIKLSSGNHLLTVPTKHHGLAPINQTEIDYSHRWINQHLQTIKSAFGKTPRFDQIYPQVQNILDLRSQNLADLNLQTIIWGITTILGFGATLELNLEKLNSLLIKSTTARLKTILTDQQTGVPRPEGNAKGTEWTAQICHSLRASEYFHGGTAQAGYMDLDYYRNLGITPVAQNWRCPEYPQQFSDKIGFISNLSILDLLFNVEPDAAQKILGLS